MNNIEKLASIVDQAARTASAIPQLSETDEFDEMGAYEIQMASIALRTQRGESIVGVKMGFTSRAKAIQMGVDDVIYGWLTDQMSVKADSTINLDQYVHPRVEPELAVRMARPLEGKVSAEEAWDAVDVVAPAMEIIDSRYQNFKFSLADVIADNSSSSGFVIGEWTDKLADVSDLGMDMTFDGKTVQAGSTQAVLGDPRLSVAKAAEMLARQGKRVEAGWIILTGGATEATHLTSGTHIVNVIDQIGQVSFHTR